MFAFYFVVYSMKKKLNTKFMFNFSGQDNTCLYIILNEFDVIMKHYSKKMLLGLHNITKMQMNYFCASREPDDVATAAAAARRPLEPIAAGGASSARHHPHGRHAAGLAQHNPRDRRHRPAPTQPQH
jgi:hypothetical protein